MCSSDLGRQVGAALDALLHRAVGARDGAEALRQLERRRERGVALEGERAPDVVVSRHGPEAYHAPAARRKRRGDEKTA